LDVTRKCRLTEEDLNAIKNRGTQLTDLIFEYLKLWRGDAGCLPYLHDPLAIAVNIDESVVEMVEKEILIETGGAFTRGMTFNSTDSHWWNDGAGNCNAMVCRDVDSTRFIKLFMERILDYNYK
jgi:purine nucleosidase